MAKKKRRRRTSLITKAINVGILLLAFARPLQLLAANQPLSIIAESTAGIVRPGGRGGFSQDLAIRFYGPMVAAIVLKKAIGMVRRTARF